MSYQLYLQVLESSKTRNIFDGIMNTASPPSLLDELQCYLAADVKDVTDRLMWWYERQKIFPQLSHMSHDYLSIPSEFLFF